MGNEETRDDEWGNKVARITFRWTVILAVAFVVAMMVLTLR